MKRFFTILFISIICSNYQLAQCPVGDLNISNQLDIDSFAIKYPNCIQFPGDINIITYSANITNLNGLSPIVKLNGSLNISNNNTLLTLSGLNNLDQIKGNVIIKDNKSLTNLDGLQNLKAIGGDLNIFQNVSLKSIDKLLGLTYFNNSIQINYNDSLSNLLGLDNISWISGDLRINVNKSLNSFENLKKLKEISGSLLITNNPRIKNFVGFESLEKIGDDLDIEFNDSLLNFQGLEILKSINRDINVYYNKNLKNIEHLINVKKIDGNILIYNNDELSSLKGLDNIDYKTIKEVTIEQSQILSDCAVKSICNFLEFVGIGKVSNNASGCATSFEIIVNCVATPTVEILPIIPQIYPNPTSGIFNIRNGSNQLFDIIIINSLGKVVYELKNSSSEIDISHFPNGIYILKLQHGNNSYIKKLIKQ